jgi:hypothetical protein
MTSSSQEKDFKDYVISRDLLGESIEWIGRDLSPDEVFKESDLDAWASRNLDPEDIFDKSNLIRLAAENCSNPEEIFDTSELEAWALNNGWVKFS